MSFARDLQTGRVAEGLIAAWLMNRGASVMPAYEIEKSAGKGPQLYSDESELVAPDLIVFTHKGIQWVEAKHKSVFTWHRKTEQWTTGIDLRHYCDYLRVAQKTRMPVFLMFFHRESTPDQRDLMNGSPQECPTGLFGGELFGLVARENHRSPHFDPGRTGMKGHGNSGMVYWSVNNLKQYAPRDEVFEIAQRMRAVV